LRTIRESIDVWLQRAVLALVVALLGFAPAAFGGVRPSEMVILWWIIIGVILLWMVRIWVAPKFRFYLPPTSWAIIPFVIYSIWRYLNADVEHVARIGELQVILLAVFFFAFINSLYEQESTRTVCYAMVGFAMLFGMYAIYQWLTGTNTVWGLPRPAYEGRGSGPYVSPNHLAGLLEMVVPIGIAFVAVSRMGALPRIALAYATIVALIGLGVTGSRGGWLATGATTLLLAIMLLRSRVQWWVTLAVLVFVAGFGKVLYSRILAPRMEKVQSYSIAEDGRYRIWSSSWRMWLDQPWAGVGPNHFDIRYPAYRADHWQLHPRAGYAHNDYLNALTDWGVIGLGLLLLPIIVAAYGLARSWRFLRRSGGEFRQKGGNRLALVLGTSAGLVAISIHSFFDFNMHIPANALVAITLFALLTTTWRFATERYWFSAHWGARALVTALLALATAFSAKAVLQETRETWALREVERAPNDEKALAALRKAYFIDGKNFEIARQIGERLRFEAWRGDADFREKALEAVEWFDRAITLNPYDVFSYLRCGMTLDWLEEHARARPYFDKAIALDPNHYMTRALVGWHFFQVDEYAETIEWMNRSLKLNNTSENSLAYTYLKRAADMLAKQGNDPKAGPSATPDPGKR
jgi:O-antigen ligase